MAKVALSVLMVMKNDAAAEVKQLMPEAMERTGGGKQPKVTVQMITAAVEQCLW